MLSSLLPPQITHDMQKVDQMIHQALKSDVQLITQVGKHIINGGGKRLRPLLLVLSARASGCHQMEPVYYLAAIIEIIHVTTLLHDDVVDHSEMRRGQPTANLLFGNAASVLVGDFLYSRAFQMMVTLDNMPVMQVLSEAVNIIAEGEVLQLGNIGDTTLTEADYLKVIRYKTAKLFEASARLGAMLANATKSEQKALMQYGAYMGTAFQVIDDLLDFSGDHEIIGKNLGDDLAEGKLTLPLIYAIREGTPEQAQMVKAAVSAADRSQLAQIVDIVSQTRSLVLTKSCAENLVDQAISAISGVADSVYKETLIELAHFSTQRNF